MSEGINRVTVKRLARVIQDIDDQRCSCYSYGDYNRLVARYVDMIAVREDMRQQDDPIGGRFIQPEDRQAVDHALDALHSIIMRRYYANKNAVCEESEKLLDYLRHAVEGRL